MFCLVTLSGLDIVIVIPQRITSESKQVVRQHKTFLACASTEGEGLLITYEECHRIARARAVAKDKVQICYMLYLGGDVSAPISPLKGLRDQHES